MALYKWCCTGNVRAAEQTYSSDVQQKPANRQCWAMAIHAQILTNQSSQIKKHTLTCQQLRAGQYGTKAQPTGIQPHREFAPTSH
jgi:hypothetical protein